MGADVGLAQALATGLALLLAIGGLERFGRLQAQPRSVRYGVTTAAMFATVFLLNLVWPAGV